jgi:hypothetical protein
VRNTAHDHCQLNVGRNNYAGIAECMNFDSFVGLVRAVGILRVE